MEVKLPGYTPNSIPSSSQAGSGSSRLKVLQERLQSRARDDSVKEGRPPTWRDHPVRSVTIASYKKNKDGACHRHNRIDWPAAQRARRDFFHDAAWAEYFTQPRIPVGAVHLIIGELDTGADADPVTLAGWALEFFWSCDTAGVGVAGDVGYGEDVHGHSDDGDQ